MLGERYHGSQGLNGLQVRKTGMKLRFVTTLGLYDDGPRSPPSFLMTTFVPPGFVTRSTVARWLEFDNAGMVARPLESHTVCLVRGEGRDSDLPLFDH